jgi:hypothetical protein
MNEIDHARPQAAMFKVRSDGNKTRFRMWKTRRATQATTAHRSFPLCVDGAVSLSAAIAL